MTGIEFCARPFPIQLSYTPLSTRLRPARPGDPVFQRQQCLSREAAAYWVARSSRAMTASVWCLRARLPNTASPSRGAICPRFSFRCPSEKREQGMPGARCTRGLVCKIVQRKRTRAYRFSGGSPAFPAQWFYGLCRALPGDEFVLSPSLRIDGDRPGWVGFASASLTSATDARTTRFCRTRTAPFVLRAGARSRKPALRSVCAPTLPRPPHPSPRS